MVAVKKTVIMLLAGCLLGACASQPFPMKDGGDGIFYAESPPDYIFVRSYGWPYYYGFNRYPYYYPWWLYTSHHRYDNLCMIYPGRCTPWRYPTMAYTGRWPAVGLPLHKDLPLHNWKMEPNPPNTTNNPSLVGNDQSKRRLHRTADPLRLKPTRGKTRSDALTGQRSMRLPSTTYERPTISADRGITPSHRSPRTSSIKKN